MTLTATSASPRNVLATLIVEPPASLTATVGADRTVDLAWPASPTAASHGVEYSIARRDPGATAYVEIARTGATGFTDAPAAGTSGYLVRTIAGGFTSNGGAFADAVVPP